MLLHSVYRVDSVQTTDDALLTLPDVTLLHNNVSSIHDYLCCINNCKNIWASFIYSILWLTRYHLHKQVVASAVTTLLSYFVQYINCELNVTSWSAGHTYELCFYTKSSDENKQEKPD